MAAEISATGVEFNQQNS